MATEPPDDWPYRMALHVAMTKPASEPVPCPACGDDEMENLWPPEENEPAPPAVCPTCLYLVGDGSD